MSVKAEFDVLMFCRILHGNNLIGIIPKELGMLKSLRVLDLGMNQLTGPIPPEIGDLNILETL
jgi:Leucine-rich repeat (LRR) protein